MRLGYTGTVALKSHQEGAMPIVFRSAKQLKDHLPQIMRDARKADVVITMHGKPAAFLRHFTEHELEGAMLMQSSTVRRRMKRALEQIRAGRGVSLDALMEQVATGGR
jgi:PHD/YefM family antitoxin component YafN of YafNO toxin-antitoxin module